MRASSPSIRGIWRTDPDACAAYAEAAGIHRLVPCAVAVAADADDVSTIVRWAASAGHPITARGSGSSMSGGAVGRGVVLDLSRINELGAADSAANRISAGAGAICAAVDAAAARVQRRFPLDPSSARFCTVGGMAATNAAGARTLRFGPMRSWVRGLECVFADGTRAWVRRGVAPSAKAAPAALERFAAIAPTLRAQELRAPSRHTGVRKDSAGYALAQWAASDDLVDLLVGSEGTLALFTAVELALAPIPAARATLIAAFASLEAAAAGAVHATDLGASACELLDSTFLSIARQGAPLPVPDGAEAVLLVELESDAADTLTDRAAQVADAFSAAGALHVESTDDPTHASALWHLRHAASPVLAAMSRALTSMQVVEDGAVPVARLPEYVHAVRAAMAREGFGGVVFGHAGDGHVHANVLVDTTSADWRARLERVFDAVVGATVSLGGTLSGEHGDGRLRAGEVERLWPSETVERFRAVKRAFDPDGVLNPGVKLPAAGAPRFGAPIKYDPALAPLPAAAARVLARVQRERAWHRPRLELLDEEIAR